MDVDNLLKCALAQEKEHAVILLDPDGRVVAWFAGAVDVLGYTEPEMIGQSLARLFTPEDIERGEVTHELRSARRYGKAEDDRWQVRKDGLRIWANGILTSLRDRGQLVGFVKILRDRTDVRGQLDSLQNRLEAAAQAQEHRHMLLGTIAHELRNPLAPLANAGKLIAAAVPDNPTVRYSTKLIERQVGYISQLLTDMLELTRANVGKIQPHFECVDLGAVIQKALETCGTALRDKEQTAEALLPGAITLEADPIRLQQVLVNLVNNSSKYSPPGAKVWIKATVEGEEAVVRVEDNGKGIPSELLPRIFDLLTQAGTPDEMAHGLGLGLALVKSLVEMHGGTVQARSEGEGKGAEIIVRLPVTQARKAPSACEPQIRIDSTAATRAS
jgi:PAS domain S-box-containing protein